MIGRRNFAEAHQHVDKAIDICRKNDDLIREAWFLETKAQIFLSDEKYHDCLLCVETSIQMLEDTQSFANLAESLITKLQAEFLSDQVPESIRTYNRVLKIAQEKLSSEFTENLIKVFSKLITESQYESIIEVEAPLQEGIKFVYLDNDVAIIIEEDIKAGDHVMIDYEGSIYAGIINYDHVLNLIILEFNDDEPLVVSESEVTNIRKIIAICSREEFYSLQLKSSLGMKKA